MVKSFYILFFAVLVLGFVGFGIAAFYPGPDIEGFQLPEAEASGVPAPQAEEARVRAYTEAHEQYTRNASIIAIVSAIAILSLGLMLPPNFSIVVDGVLLGGVFTLSYGIYRSLLVGDAMFQFLTVAIGLPVALALGYLRFVRRA